MDTSEIYQTIIRPMISDAGGKMSGAAGIDDSDVVTLNESKRIERLYLKNLLRESVKSTKKEAIKKKIERIMTKRGILQEADVALDDYESAISALRKTRKKKKIFGKKKENEEDPRVGGALEEPDEDVSLEDPTDSNDAVSDINIDTESLPAGSDVAILSVINNNCKRKELLKAKVRATEELLKFEEGGLNPLSSKVARVNQYYKAGGSTSSSVEAIKAGWNDFANLPGGFDDKTYWSAAFISYCMEPYKSIGFKPSMAHVVFAKEAYNNRGDFGSTDTPDDGLVLFFKDEGLEPKPGDILFYLRSQNNEPLDLASTRKFFEDHHDDSVGHPAHSDIFIGGGKAIGGNLSNSVREVNDDKYTAFITRLVKKEG
jgi:hypothetical protein